MPAREVVVGSRIGLHGRPAKIVVQTAQAQKAVVRITVGDKPPVDARSIIAVLALGAHGGDKVTIEATGDDADEALDAMAEILAKDLDADA
jgi:phosphocarrier protein HPr